MGHEATIEIQEQRPSPLAWILAAVLAALLGFSFYDPIAWMIERWSLPDSYYSHGFLVPVVAGYFVWRDRHALMAEAPRRFVPGLLLVLAGLLILLSSGWISVFFTAGFALILTAWGVAGYVLGAGVMRRLLFPVFLLLFMVPPPLQWIETFSFNLKIMVAHITVFLLDMAGIAAVIGRGSTIFLETTTVTVGNACSGLRSLIALIFLGILFAAWAKMPFHRRALLFLLSMPIAIISNVARVLLLCLVAWKWGGDAIMAEHSFFGIKTSVHDVSGYLIFIVAYALLYLTLKLLLRGLPQDEVATEPAADAAAAAPPVGRPGVLRRALVMVALLGLTSYASATFLYPGVYESENLHAPRIPLEIGAWEGRDLEIGPETRQILETDDVIQRNYRHPLHRQSTVQLAVVFSPRNRRVAHPPEVCYTAAGWEMSAKRIEQYDDVPEMVRLTLSIGGREDLVLYCYLAGEDFTADYLRQQWNIVRNAITRESTSSALIRFSTTVQRDESEEEAEARMLEFVRAAMPVLRRHLVEEVRNERAN